MERLHRYKVSTHLFSDPAIRHILGYPNGDTYLVILFYLRELACATCDGGDLSISQGNPLLVRDIAEVVAVAVMSSKKPWLFLRSAGSSI
jgi:hypothetical protein